MSFSHNILKKTILIIFVIGLVNGLMEDSNVAFADDGLCGISRNSLYIMAAFLASGIAFFCGGWFAHENAVNAVKAAQDLAAAAAEGTVTA